MSDPFSVTGSAVGVASLGLTICQGFLLYYGPYKSFHDDVDEVVSRIQSLNDLLALLQKVVTESDATDTSPATQSGDLVTQKNIKSCHQGLNRLQKMLDKCHRTCPPGREKASRLRTQVDRLLYPFRRETLMNLMETVSWLQANVDTTLQVLHL
jgi:chaperonin cofactor prefoldin